MIVAVSCQTNSCKEATSDHYLFRVLAAEQFGSLVTGLMCKTRTNKDTGTNGYLVQHSAVEWSCNGLTSNFVARH